MTLGEWLTNAPAGITPPTSYSSPGESSITLSCRSARPLCTPVGSAAAADIASFLTGVSKPAAAPPLPAAAAAAAEAAERLRRSCSAAGAVHIPWSSNSPSQRHSGTCEGIRGVVHRVVGSHGLFAQAPEVCVSSGG